MCKAAPPVRPALAPLPLPPLPPCFSWPAESVAVVSSVPHGWGGGCWNAASVAPLDAHCPLPPRKRQKTASASLYTLLRRPNPHLSRSCSLSRRYIGRPAERCPSYLCPPSAPAHPHTLAHISSQLPLSPRSRRTSVQALNQRAAGPSPTHKTTTPPPTPGSGPPDAPSI